MRAAGAAGAVALLAVVFAAAVLAHLAAPASLSLAPPLVDAVWLAEALAAALVAALAELLLLPRAGTIEGGKATGKSASRPVPASLTALPHGGRHVDLGRRKRGKHEVEAAG